MCSYGDFVALSDTCDAATALLIKREVSDGVIAPDYTPEALEILREKRKGTYNVIKIDPNYQPNPIEHKQVFGITFEQGRNEVKLNDDRLFENIPTEQQSLPEMPSEILSLHLSHSNIPRATAFVMSKMDRQLELELGNRVEFIAPAWQATKQTRGGFANVRRS